MKFRAFAFNPGARQPFVAEHRRFCLVHSRSLAFARLEKAIPALLIHKIAT
jgi:hypothetical protein